MTTTRGIAPPVWIAGLKVIGVDERPVGASRDLRVERIGLGSAGLTLENGLVHGHVAVPGAT
jgi:hypothetical protein